MEKEIKLYHMKGYSSSFEGLQSHAGKNYGRENRMTDSIMITEQSVSVFASDRSYTRSNKLSITVKQEHNQIKKKVLSKWKDTVSSWR